jgi:hypothetical protein
MTSDTLDSIALRAGVALARYKTADDADAKASALAEHGTALAEARALIPSNRAYGHWLKTWGLKRADPCHAPAVRLPVAGVPPVRTLVAEGFVNSFTVEVRSVPLPDQVPVPTAEAKAALKRLKRRYDRAVREGGIDGHPLPKDREAGIRLWLALGTLLIDPEGEAHQNGLLALLGLALGHQVVIDPRPIDPVERDINRAANAHLITPPKRRGRPALKAAR